ncbi:hypothetical protein QQS21_009324 [Conoideocrella luteorostrata]|uniref:Nonsense-mediated mRNA decay factor n=1 Tax=Conoideocrella luteorostrata TaxID=1105319 RepID=A0AAJ0CH38_9HYPO|nr:hypothetical protein QQS21_009324 [Conoideocrella luteorostrata]
MATAQSQASQYWHQALKIRKHLLKQLEKLQAESASGVDISKFEVVEGLLEKFRLAFAATIFLDFEYGVKENVEEGLWGLHTSINTEYRRIQGRLKQSSHAVERRKVEKSYNNFLRVAQKFYKGYIQRLTGRYDVPELRRVAQGIEVEQMTAADRISPVPTELHALVLKSCHSTLLRMGDLSRYRTQARHKNSSYETALTYYSLAHYLKPSAGHAYHQMGMVHLDQGNHLDVVYHFYRSWAVEFSHPNARSNLESEFRSLQLPNSSKPRPNASAAQDAFSMWFVRLHALFYKGEDFPQQGELEGEVMHRLEMACRSEKSTDTLLKMALVNISAHHIAATNYADAQTATASRFYQFTLRFNALFISNICATFEPELKEAASANGSGDTSVKSSVITPPVEALLPILRLYCMWLAARRQEVCAAVQAFGGVVPGMIQNLLKVFTLLCVFTYNQETLASCPYLLKEDFEIRGFQPLSEDIVPEACRCFCGEDGTPKSYLENPSSRMEPVQESMARVLDILRCAYFLAEDPTFPVSYRVVDNWLIFEYRLEASSSKPASTAPIAAIASSVTTPLGFCDVNEHQAEDLTSRTRLSVQQPDAAKVPSPNSVICELQPEDSVEDQSLTDDAENTLINMLTPFLKPPTPTAQSYQQQACSSYDPSSYGMPDKTANEAPGSHLTEPSPNGSIPSGKFAQLPWAWFNTPKPDDTVTGSLTPRTQDAFSAQPSPYNSPRHSGAIGHPLDDPFATPGRNHYGAFANGNATQQNRRNFSSPGVPGVDASGAGSTNHRSSLLQTLSETNVPRSSPFTQWAKTQKSVRENLGPAASPWGARAFGQAHQSSGTSVFSHPSSLYQGTPANGVGLGLDNIAGEPKPAGFASSLGGEAGRYFQIDQTTSSYDDAIMQAAYYGNK